MVICKKFDIGYRTFGVRDSKMMTERQREEVFKFLQAHPDVEWGIGKVGPAVIDKINILQATRLAMVRAVKNLEKTLLAKPYDRKVSLGERVLLIDGNFGIKLPKSTSLVTQHSIIKGDSKVPIISMASIIAKVTRDRMMQNYHKKYPDYVFNQHKGYPTKQHYQTILAYGPCPIHRQSFRLKF